MKILVNGAGVIGTLYAARLQAAGHRVTVRSLFEAWGYCEREAIPLCP